MELLTFIHITIFNSILFLSFSLAYKYKGIPNEELFLPCPGEEENSQYQFFRYNLSAKRTDDDILMAGGVAEWIYEGDFEEEPIQVVVNVYKKNRGQWAETPFVLYRQDLCKALFNSKEMWYKYLNQLPDKTCPPKYGTLYPIKMQKAEIELDLPARNQEGEYKLVIRCKTSKVNMCTMLCGSLVRI